MQDGFATGINLMQSRQMIGIQKHDASNQGPSAKYLLGAQ